MRASWSRDGAEAFALACATLDLKGATVAEVAALARQMPMLTIYDAAAPIGAVVLHDRTVHIAVLPHWRGRWLNKAVLVQLQAALKLARRALIDSRNTRAHRFAQRLGWKQIGTEGNYVEYRSPVA